MDLKRSNKIQMEIILSNKLNSLKKIQKKKKTKKMKMTMMMTVIMTKIPKKKRILMIK